MDLTQLTDEELEILRRDAAAECERRQRLATAPEQVAAIARQYAEDGGDPADLIPE